MKWFQTRAIVKHCDIVMLQGPVGPFFADLHAQLEARGKNIIRILFDKNDASYADEHNTLRFEGNLDLWVQRFALLIRIEKPEFLIVFGDERPHHAEAIKIAKELGIKVWCLEEGYIRPGFIACELEGNNANSPLTEAILKDVYYPQITEKENRYAVASKWYFGAKRYFINSLMSKKERDNTILHRPRFAIKEIINWSKNSYLYFKYSAFDKKRVAKLNHLHSKRYAVVALQVHDDIQIKVHGEGWDSYKLINDVTSSFAKHAPQDLQLVFKIHPYDRGHLPYKSWILEAARRNGVLNRIVILQTGGLGKVMRHSYGMVTVNSTGGLIALSHNKPLLALGKAFYDREDLTFQGTLDQFWTMAEKPDNASWNALKSQIFAKSLIKGDYYAPKVRIKTAKAVADRILAKPLV